MTDNDDGNGDDRRGGPSGPYRHTFDRETDRVSEELIRAVAVLNDADPTELAVLADAVDPEALDALIRSATERPRQTGEVRVVFDYHDRRIEVESDGTISIGPRRADDEE